MTEYSYNDAGCVTRIVRRDGSEVLSSAGPVSSKGISFLNDLLGTMVGAKSGATYTAAALSAFGEDLNRHSPTPTSNSHSFYTGKPEVAGLGHAFLMRNYRASLGKWQTADPMGYPENAPKKLCFGGKPRAQRSARRARKGPRWNQLAYCNNGVTGSVDLWGCWKGYTTDEIADTYAKIAKETIAGGDLARIKGVNEVTDNATLLRPPGIYYKIDKPFYEYHSTEWVTE